MYDLIRTFSIVLLSTLTLLHGQEKLTLKDALQKGFSHSFDLKKAALDIDIAELNAYQASLLPNPQFSINGETASFSCDQEEDNPSISYGVAQLLETRWKRRARRDVAAAMQGFAEASYLQSKAEYGFSIKAAFTNAAFAKRYMDIAFQNKEMQEKILICLNEKPEEGKISPSDKMKQSGSCQLYDLACKKKANNYKEKKLELAYLIGRNDTDFDIDDEFVDHLGPPQFYFDEKNNYFVKVKDWQVEIAQQQAILEETKKTPDISLNAGLFHENKAQPSGIFLGLSFELPIFNNHDAAISKAYLEIEKQEASRQEFVNRLNLELRKKQLAIEQAYEELLCYREKILYKMQEGYDEVLDCHHGGKLDVCEVYKAKLVCLEQEEKYLEIVERYQDVLLEFEKLIGRIPGI